MDADKRNELLNALSGVATEVYAQSFGRGLKYPVDRQKISDELLMAMNALVAAVEVIPYNGHDKMYDFVNQTSWWQKAAGLFDGRKLGKELATLAVTLRDFLEGKQLSPADEAKMWNMVADLAENGLDVMRREIDSTRFELEHGSEVAKA